MQLWKVLIASLTVIGLAACSSTPDNPAPIEDKNATGTSNTGTGGTGSQTSGAGGQGAGSGSTLSGGGAGGSSAIDPLKDPSSPLSQRIIFFDYDSFVVKNEYRPLLEAHAAYLKANANARLRIEGNTDERGSREYNLALGQKRAEAVKQLLNLIGVNDRQLETVSFGEEKPRNPAISDAAFAENRRSELRYAGE